MMPDVVTTITAHPATADDLTETDYREIYAEVRQKMTLRQFVSLAGPHYSIAWWSQFERTEKGLTYHARVALRKIVGLPELPPPVDVALAGAVDEDATICRIGDEQTPARRVLLISHPGSITVHWNGTGPTIVDDVQSPTSAHVTPVTAQRQRPGLWRPTLPQEWRQRAAAAGVDVRSVVLRAIEDAEHDNKRSH